MKRCFTVTELLVAIAIIVILAGILIGAAGYASRRGDEAKTIAAIQHFSAALEAFRAEKGYYPPCTNLEDVRFYRKSSGELCLVLGSDEYKFVNKQDKAFMELSDVTATSKSTAEDFTDAWGEALRYKCPGTHNKAAFDLLSKGLDKTADTDDDISNWLNESQQ